MGRCRPARPAPRRQAPDGRWRRTGRRRVHGGQARGWPGPKARSGLRSTATTQGGAPSARATTRRILGQSMPPGRRHDGDPRHHPDGHADLVRVRRDHDPDRLHRHRRVPRRRRGNRVPQRRDRHRRDRGRPALRGRSCSRPRLGPVPASSAASDHGRGSRRCWVHANLIVVAFAAIAVASAGNLILDVTRTTIFQRVVPDAYRGRFSGLLLDDPSVSEAGGTLLVPLLVTRGRVRPGSWASSDVAVGRGDGHRGPADRRGGRRSPGPPTTSTWKRDRPPAAVRRPVPRPRRRRATIAFGSRMVVAAGEVIVRQGDTGRPVLRDRRRDRSRCPRSTTTGGRRGSCGRSGSDDGLRRARDPRPVRLAPATITAATDGLAVL